MTKIATNILAILSMATTEGPRLYLPGQLDKKIYQDVNKVLEANGGKWNRSAKAHVFDEPADEAIEQALLTGEFRRVKQELGQFDTPPEVADRVCELAQLEAGQLIYEPSAGIGNLVAAAIRRTRTGVGIFANEIDPKRREQCIHNNGGTFAGGGIGCKDFLTIDPVPRFDRVIMNPPFAKQADIDHVRHALKFLKPGGRLVAIMSASAMFRTNRKTQEFRSLVDAMDSEWEKLPEGAFASSGTNVNAVILAVDVP